MFAVRQCASWMSFNVDHSQNIPRNKKKAKGKKKQKKTFAQSLTSLLYRLYGRLSSTFAIRQINVRRGLQRRSNLTNFPQEQEKQGKSTKWTYEYARVLCGLNSILHLLPRVNIDLHYCIYLYQTCQFYVLPFEINVVHTSSRGRNTRVPRGRCIMPKPTTLLYIFGHLI